jgi:hypothetical protein
MWLIGLEQSSPGSPQMHWVALSRIVKGLAGASLYYNVIFCRDCLGKRGSAALPPFTKGGNVALQLTATSDAVACDEVTLQD